MTKRSSRIFKKAVTGMTVRCKQKLQHIQLKLHGFWQPKNHPTSHSWPLMDELALVSNEVAMEKTHPVCVKSALEKECAMEQKTLTVTQWRLDDNPSNNSPHDRNKLVTMVVMEFPSSDPYQENAKLPKNNDTMNYTIAGEDPNLRITHYFPSNRLH